MPNSNEQPAVHPVHSQITETGLLDLHFCKRDARPGFIAYALRDRCEVSDTTSTSYIGPGSSWENGIAGSFNCNFRAKFLSTELFITVPEAELLSDRWRCEYNTFRIHLALKRGKFLEAAQPRAVAFQDQFFS